jgi:5-methylcytosine-specific restriction endonuclease McrA
MLPKPRPKVLEKREASTTKAREWRLVRQAVLRRDQWRCRVCGGKAYDVHHLLARSLGGKDVLANLVAVCRSDHELIHGHALILRWRDEQDRAGTLRVERVA